MLKKIYGVFLKCLVSLFGIDFAKKFDAYLRFRRKLNLKDPQTLADKVTYLFLHKSNPLMSACTDKWAVREYIASKGLEHILIPTFGGPWSGVDEIDFNVLPSKFILKATHGCKMNYLVPDKSKLDMNACKKNLQTWLNTAYGSYSLEYHYKAIPHRIYAETLLDVPNGLIDYKFHCMNGVPQFVLVCSERKLDYNGQMQVKRELYDDNWNSLCSQVLPPSVPLTPKPSMFDEMKNICSILSKDFTFVRVDLYEVNGKVYFGELTFSPSSGVFSHYTEGFLTEMGKRLKI